MRRILRPLFALVFLMMGSTWVLAQEPPASLQAHSRNPKHQAQANRLETAARVEAASLQKYEKTSPLKKRVRKGHRPTYPTMSKEKDPQSMYLDLRTTKRSTREVEEVNKISAD